MLLHAWFGNIIEDMQLTCVYIYIYHLGYTVQGVYMSNWDESSGQCSTDNDYNDVIEISNKIGIDCTRVEFVKEYWNEIFR